MSGTLDGGMAILEISECQSLLKRGGVGILATAGTEAPLLRPVNFVFQDDFLLIRTGEGQILEAATASDPASFVISEVDRFEHSGWSVVVVGTLVERSRLETTPDLPLRPWAKAEKNHIVGLAIKSISGRRLPGTQANR